MHGRTGPALWILGCFIVYALLLFFFFNTSATTIVSEKKLYTVARDASWAPFNFSGKERQITAFSDELLEAIADDQDFIVHIQPSSPDNIFIGLLSNDYQGVLAIRLPDSFFPNKFYASPSYYPFGPVVIAPIHSSIRSAEQLKGKIVGITETVEFFMEYPTNPEATYISYPHISDALEAMEQGFVQAVMASRLLAETYVNSFYKGIFTIVTPPLSDLGLRLFTRHTEEGSELVSYFSRGLHNLKKNGTYDALLKKWHLSVNVQDDDPNSTTAAGAFPFDE